MAWRNRIIGYGTINPEEALANEENWRIHPRVQSEALLDLLRDVGLVQNVVVNVRRSEAWPPHQRNVHTILDGHLRIMLALRDGQDSVPVTYVDLDPEEERLVLLTFDTLTSFAVADRVKIGELLDQLRPASESLAQLVAELRQSIRLPETPGRTVVLPDFDRGFLAGGPAPATSPANAADEPPGAAPPPDRARLITCPACGHEFVPSATQPHGS